MTEREWLLCGCGFVASTVLAFVFSLLRARAWRQKCADLLVDLADLDATIEEGRTNRQLRDDLTVEIGRRKRAEEEVNRLKRAKPRVVVAVELPALIETDFALHITQRVVVSPSAAGPGGMDLLLTGVSLRPPCEPPHRVDSAWWEPLRTWGRFFLRVSRTEVVSVSLGMVVRPWETRKEGQADCVMRLDPPLRFESTEVIEVGVDPCNAFYYAPQASLDEIRGSFYDRKAVLVLHGKWVARGGPA